MYPSVTSERLTTRACSVMAARSSFATLFNSASSLAAMACPKSCLILASVEVGTTKLCHKNHLMFDTVFTVEFPIFCWKPNAGSHERRCERTVDSGGPVTAHLRTQCSAV